MTISNLRLRMNSLQVPRIGNEWTTSALVVFPIMFTILAMMSRLGFYNGQSVIRFGIVAAISTAISIAIGRKWRPFGDLFGTAPIAQGGSDDQDQ